MGVLEHIGLPGLAYLIENTKIRAKRPEDTIEKTIDVLSEFLKIDRYELMKAIDETKTALFAHGSVNIIPDYPARKDIEELEKELQTGDGTKRTYSMLVASSLLGSFYTGLHGVPIRLFSPIGADEPRVIISLSLLLSRVLGMLNDKSMYKVRLDENEGLAIVSEPEIVTGKNTLILEALLGSRSPYINQIVAETLYINRVVSAPSDTFLHGVLGLISFSPGLDEVESLSSRLRGLERKDILSFITLLGFYVGIPGLKKKVRMLQYDKRLYRTMPVTHDILLDALSRYRSDGDRYFGKEGISPASIIERALKRSLTSSEAKALGLAMVVDLRRKTLSRMVEEDNIKLLIGDALSALYKALSYVYSSDQVNNIPTGLITEDGIRRVPGGEDTPLYEFLRKNFEAFDVKYMDDVIFELPFRLRLLKKTFAKERTAVVDASVALNFIYSLGSPMRKRTGYRLLTFVADALQTGRLSSAEIFYDKGRTRLKYVRSTKIASTKRILETSFPLLSDIFAFSWIVRGILDRNSPGGKHERPASVAERYTSKFIREFIKLRKKYIGSQKRFLYLIRIHPIVLFSIPLALITSYYGESLSELLEYIDFVGDHPSKSVLYIAHGDAEEIFTKLRYALNSKPYVIDKVHIHLFKVAASSGLTLSLRDEIKEERLRPLRLREVMELSMLVKRTITFEEALYSLFNIASNFGYVSLYGEAETVVTLAYRNGSVGIVNTSYFQDVAYKVAARDVAPFDTSFLSEASKGRMPVRDERILQEYFGSFFRNISEGYLPLIAKGGNKRYIRLIEI